MEDACCENCLFWTDDWEESEYQDVGTCRRYPPTRNSKRPKETGLFPLTSCVCWCGEYKEKKS